MERIAELLVVLFACACLVGVVLIFSDGQFGSVFHTRVR